MRWWWLGPRVPDSVKPSTLLAQSLSHHLQSGFKLQNLLLLTRQRTIQCAHRILEERDLGLQLGRVTHGTIPGAKKPMLHYRPTLHPNTFCPISSSDMPPKNPASRPVYSTDKGRLCPQCQRAVTDCVCGSARPSAVGDGIARIRRETKGRGGKSVTVIEGIPLPPEGLKRLCTQLKQRCGTGGAVKGLSLEIQGDQREACRDVLVAAGFQVKFSGG